jgi:predicted RNA-binding Zn ribbon-like protein
VITLCWSPKDVKRMDDHDKRRVGEQVEPGDRPKAPGRLELLQRFVNSYNHDLPADWDRLGTAGRAAVWLHDKGLAGPRDAVSDADAERLRALRESLRALAVANHGGRPPPDAVAVLRAAAAKAPLRIACGDDGRVLLEGEADGVDGAVAILLGIVHEAQLTGQWARVKGCRQCGYMFYDRSKNRSAAWCAMAICGNRTKNRAYKRRRRSADG